MAMGDRKERVVILYYGFIVMLIILIIYQHEEIKILEEIIKEMGGDIPTTR